MPRPKAGQAARKPGDLIGDAPLPAASRVLFATISAIATSIKGRGLIAWIRGASHVSIVLDGEQRKIALLKTQAVNDHRVPQSVLEAIEAAQKALRSAQETADAAGMMLGKAHADDIERAGASGVHMKRRDVRSARRDM